MARDEIEGRKKRGGDPREATGEEMTRERMRDRESAPGRAGGTGRVISPDEEDVPRRSPGTSEDRKQLDEGGI
ncbi:MAG TPA: hypothetical protein VGA31_10710 [Thermoanaerobaculia bacterium]